MRGQTDVAQPEVPVLGDADVIRWAYGVTTVPSRRDDLLPRSLQSLSRAGFDTPHLFIDGCDDSESYRREFGLDVTARCPKVRVAGHWTLSLWELYVRNPSAHRFALFQDDVIYTTNLRAYLDRTPYPTAGYLNLYTVPVNEALRPKSGEGVEGVIPGFYPSNQMGKGALALVFDLDTVVKLLSSPEFVRRPQDVNRGHRSIDGGVVTALKKVGITEYVHFPSLVQHVGDISSMGNSLKKKPDSFPSETFDAVTWLTEPARL